MSEYIQDKEVFLPASNILVIDNKSFDLSEVPFEFSLRFYELLDLFTQMSEGKFLTSSDYGRLFPVIYDMLKFVDDSTDEKWLRKKITLKNFTYVMTTISTAIFFDGKKKDEAQADGTGQLTLVGSSQA